MGGRFQARPSILYPRGRGGGGLGGGGGRGAFRNPAICFRFPAGEPRDLFPRPILVPPLAFGQADGWSAGELGGFWRRRVCFLKRPFMNFGPSKGKGGAENTPYSFGRPVTRTPPPFHGRAMFHPGGKGGSLAPSRKPATRGERTSRAFDKQAPFWRAARFMGGTKKKKSGACFFSGAPLTTKK